MSERLALVRARALSPEWRALHALYCVGAVSVRVGSELIAEFGRMVTEGYAQPRARFPAQGRTTYFITNEGRRTARGLFTE
jgi:hypothetical protein